MCEHLSAGRGTELKLHEGRGVRLGQQQFFELRIKLQDRNGEAAHFEGRHVIADRCPGNLDSLFGEHLRNSAIDDEQLAQRGCAESVDQDGGFSTPLELTQGRWAITITATSDQGKTASLTRTVTVAYKGVILVVTISGGPAWLKVWVDGKLAPGIHQSGDVFQAGRVLTFSGSQSVEVRSGSSGNTFFTLNGVSLGALGRAGIPETWHFAPPNPPTKTQRY